MKSHELARKLLELPDLDVVSNESYCGGCSIVDSIELVKSASGYVGASHLEYLKDQIIEIQSRYKEEYKQASIQQIQKRITVFEEAPFDAIYLDVCTE